jgi:hypothetical protein
MARTFPETSLSNRSFAVKNALNDKMGSLRPKPLKFRFELLACPITVIEHGPVPPALIRAKCLRIRLVKGLVLDKQGWGGAGRSAPFLLRPIMPERRQV